ncbi:MAG: ABC transporter permease [Chloroflexi bacterium]|nr:ABC transporter permease [Chloroflexota bacterium]
MGFIRRTSALVRKETIQMLRDRRTLLLILIMPVLELFLFAYAVSLTLDHLPTAVADLSQDEASRQFLDALVASNYFDITLYVADEAEALRAIDRGQVKVGVVIPPNFAAKTARGEAQALVILDGSDAFAVSAAYAAATMVAQNHSTELVRQKVRRLGLPVGERMPIETSTRVLYNPNMDDMIFLVPGLAALLLQVLTVNQTAMTLVRERELGISEQILATPVRPLEMMIGKLVPNAMLGFLEMVIIVAVGVFWFKVPFRGSVALFMGLSGLFVVSGLGLGLLVSAVASTQKEAQQISGLLLLLTMMLTGLTYPRPPMPAVVQAIGSLIPATYSIRIARGIITKGVGLSFLWQDVAVLALYSSLIMILAAKTFRKRLD